MINWLLIWIGNDHKETLEHSTKVKEILSHDCDIAQFMINIISKLL